MQLIAFRIQNYKRIRDTGFVDVNRLLILVGQNESGKTSILEALWKFKNDQGAKFTLSTDWPRDDRANRKETQCACSCRFRLTNADRTTLNRFATKDELSEVVVDRQYDSSYAVHVPTDISREIPIDRLVEAAAPLVPTTSVRPEFLNTLTQQLKAYLLKVSKSGKMSDFPSATTLQTEFRLISNQLAGGTLLPTFKQAELAYIASIPTLYDEFQSTMRKIHSKAIEFYHAIVEMLPNFIFFDEYAAFKGDCNLAALHQRQQSNELTSADRTTLAILHESHLDIASIIKDGASTEIRVREQRRLDLADASKLLTGKMSQRWSQRPYAVEFSVDGDSFATLVKSEGDSATIALEERSRGFKWFFSFHLLLMSGTSGTFRNSVILLDEPGLHLHPDAQLDLLHLLEHYAESNVVIFTTHLPFMVDLRTPERIRVVSDEGTGTTLSDQLMSRRDGDRLVLAARIGISAQLSFLISTDNLIVEGPDDFHVITALSNLFNRVGKVGLGDSVRITPGPSASEAVPMAMFIAGQGLSVVALFDSDGDGRRSRDRLTEYWQSHKVAKVAKAVTLTDLLGHEDHDFAIEDLLRGIYFETAIQVYESDLRDAGVKVSALKPADALPIRKYLTRMINEKLGQQFNRAKILARVLDKIRDSNDLAVLGEASASVERMFETLANYFQAKGLSAIAQKPKVAERTRTGKRGNTSRPSVHTEST